MTLEATLEPLLRSPRLIEITEALQARVQAERAAREKFYELSDDRKVEFIDGEVVLHSPARNAHLVVRDQIHFLLFRYVRRHALGEVRGEKCLCVFPRNDYEPDVVYFGPAKAAALTPETMKFPVPDLVVEVLSESTARNDRGVKFLDYAANGVAEYWIVDAEAETVEQYLAKEGAYEIALKSASGDIVCSAIAGLRLPVRAFFEAEANDAALRALEQAQ